IQKSYFNPNQPVRLTFEIRKDADGKETFIEGVASDTQIDKEGDRVSFNALLAMNNQINGGSVPMCFGHDKKAKLGYFVGSTIVEGKLLVRGRFDDLEKNHLAFMVSRQIKNGIPYGFSICGLSAGIPMESGGLEAKHIKLDEISVVDDPANGNAVITALIRKYLKS